MSFRVYQNGIRCASYNYEGWENDTFETKREAEVFALMWAYPVSKETAEASAPSFILGVGKDYSTSEFPVMMKIEEVFKMKKIVINNCYGDFGLSDEAVELYFKYKGWNLYKDESIKLFTNYFIVTENGEHQSFNDSKLERDDHTLLRVVEELGEKASGMCAALAIVEIPDGVEWEISEYDGLEHVAERHRTWYAE